MLIKIFYIAINFNNNEINFKKMNVQINVNVITFMAHNLQTSYDLIKAKLLELLYELEHEWSST